MNEQQPHLEVFSRNRISHSRVTILVAIIPALGLTGFAIFVLWPYRSIIAYILLVLVAFGAYYLVARGMIDLRKKSVEANTIHLGEHGIVDATSGRVLPDRQPLLLEPPQQEEDTKGPQPPVDVWRVLELQGMGIDLRTIAKVCGTTYYQVQKITSSWDEKLKKAGYTVDRQSQAD